MEGLYFWTTFIVVILKLLGSIHDIVVVRSRGKVVKEFRLGEAVAQFLIWFGIFVFFLNMMRG